MSILRSLVLEKEYAGYDVVCRFRAPVLGRNHRTRCRFLTRHERECAGIHRQAHEEKGKMPRTLDSCPNRRKPPSASSFRPKAGRYRETGTPERSCWKSSARNDFSFRVLFFDQSDDRVQSHAQIVKSRPFTTIRKSPSRPRTGCSRLYIHPSTFSIAIIDGMDSVPHNSF